MISTFWCSHDSCVTMLVRLIEMDQGGDDFLSGILLEGEGDHVAGLDDLAIPLTPQENPNSPEVEVVASRGNKGTKRSKNFNVEEDELVCEGWLIASKDPIHGANQNRTSFWGKVHAHFEKHKKEGTPSRTESSLLHRWLTIQTLVNKFCSCYEAIERRNQSGTTIQDKIASALKMFSGLDNKDGKKCSVVPCWNILKEEDKWKAKRLELLQLEKQSAAGNKTKKKSTKVARPREDEGNNIEHEKEVADNEKEKEATGHATAAETGGRKRSDGVKKVKENLRRGGGEACLEALDKMWAKKEVADNEKEKAKQERFMTALELDKEALEVEKKRLATEEKKAQAEEKKAEAEDKRAQAEEKRAQADLMKQEKEIMFTDPTSLNSIQREWLEMMQKEILARRHAN